MKTLSYRKGNLLTDKSLDVIGHQANCQNTFGSGIALSIKNMYPLAYQADVHANDRSKNVLGNVSYTEYPKTDIHDKIFRIFNLYGQNLYGTESRKTNYEALYMALEKMRLFCDSWNKSGFRLRVGFPFKMGCDRGGGDWRIVERLIEVAFDGYDGEVVIVQYDEFSH